MKKIFYLASIAALAFSSCAKDETAEVTLGVAGSGKIMATAGEADDTRAYLDSNQKFRWQANDGLGVYNDAQYPMNNDEYVLTEGAESATGIFVGQKKFDAKHHHVAVYPRLDQNLMPTGVSFTEKNVPSAKNAKAYVPNAITVQIPATQKYQPGSFYSKTVPAVSTTFNVDANGDAAIKMQPVADYLFVNIKSTEPIKTLSLQLYSGSTAYNLAGAGNVEAYNLNGNIRYYLPANNLTTNPSKVITLETGTFAADLTCHEPNTFVFVIPGGILGANKNVEAYIWVNNIPTGTDTSSANFKAVKITDANKNDANVSNWTQMNGYWNNNGTSTTKDDVEIIRGVETDDRKFDPNGVYTTYNMQLENTVFWMNHKDSKGNRTSFTYNPDGAVIIENEGDLLRYLTEYDNSAATKYYEKDAYICDNHKFDFSVANITSLSDQLKAVGTYKEYEPYFAAYLGGKFPCITGGYINEFNGNGAVISGIVMPLENKDGIFGNILKKNNNLVGVVKDVTFSGIVANNWAYVANKVALPGVILGSMATGGSISNVTVEDAQGLAILANADVDTYKALTIKNAAGLNYIVADMNLNKELEFKNWDVVSAAKTAVFGSLDATGHNVVKMPKGAEYGDLAKYIGADVAFTMNQTTLDYYGDPATSQPIIDVVYKEALYPYYVVEANQADQNVVSVLIDGESYWTGDFAKTAPKQVGGSGADAAYYKIEYAEQLAAGGNDTSDIRIMRNMHLESAVNLWEMPTVRTIDGNGKTVSGIAMEVYLGMGPNVTNTVDYSAGVAPVNADVIKNLTVDGVSIDIYTYGTTVVPPVIGGLALDARLVQNVTVKNVAIDADGQGANNENYSTAEPVVIGWLVGSANDITVEGSKVDGVDNTIIGVAGLVGKINLTTGAAIRNSAATNVETVQTSLPDFVPFESMTGWNAANYAGTSVGFVTNYSAAEKSITLTGNGQPVFFYNALNEAGNAYAKKINVIYDNGYKTLN